MSRETSPLKLTYEEITTDLLIIGGGAAGCYAAIVAREVAPDLDVLVLEKAQVERSGCLAAGINAINAYLNPGETPESFLAYVKREAADLVREDLVYTLAQGLNRAAARLEEWGVPFLKDAEGRYWARGRRSVRINGERIKPLLAQALRRSGARVLNRVVATNYLVVDGRVRGAYAFSVRTPTFYIIHAGAVLCTTGGAAGLYRPNNGGEAAHKLWYPPFNTGAGYAMGLRAGATLTTLEMRFIALRVKDVLAPTGTIAQGVSAPQVNARGEKYLTRYERNGPLTTAERLWATEMEKAAGRGPCYLDLTHLTPAEGRKLQEAFLNMCPSIVLAWADAGHEPQERPVEIAGSEPYVVGGHAQAGYWVDTDRATTLPGLFAAGDVAGGAPKKYVTGAMAEGELAARAALRYLRALGWRRAGATTPAIPEAATEYARVTAPLLRPGGLAPREAEEYLQKVMDEYAGGLATQYRLDESHLLTARELLARLAGDLDALGAVDLHELMQAHEVIDRVLVARALVEHLLARRETRWRAYQERVDYPERDDARWLKFINSRYLAGEDAFRLETVPAGASRQVFP